MIDQKAINRLKLMLDHAKRVLDHPEPDMRVLEKLLESALTLAADINAPPNPYADKALRPGLTVGEAAAAGMIAPPEPPNIDWSGVKEP